MIKNLLGENEGDMSEAEPSFNAKKALEQQTLGVFDSSSEALSDGRGEEPFTLSAFEPDSTGETVRRSGLAWSAGIAFFASVVFMLVLGWGADLLLGSSPWGVVGGIVLGSLIGFVQLFRLSAQIFDKK